MIILATFRLKFDIITFLTIIDRTRLAQGNTIGVGYFLETLLTEIFDADLFLNLVSISDLIEHVTISTYLATY